MREFRQNIFIEKFLMLRQGVMRQIKRNFLWRKKTFWLWILSFEIEWPDKL